MLHQASTAIDVVERSRAGTVIRLTERALPEPDHVADAIESFLTAVYHAEAVDWGVFDAYSARESARVMAASIDEAVERFTAQHRLLSN
jgi:hypothetical protein